MRQISYPPVNGVSQGNYFLPKSDKLAFFKGKNKKQKNSALAAKVFEHLFLGWHGSTSPTPKTNMGTDIIFEYANREFKLTIAMVTSNATHT